MGIKKPYQRWVAFYYFCFVTVLSLNIGRYYLTVGLGLGGDFEVGNGIIGIWVTIYVYIPTAMYVAGWTLKKCTVSIYRFLVLVIDLYLSLGEYWCVKMYIRDFHSGRVSSIGGWGKLRLVQ